MDLANSGGRIILTRDRDFLGMRLRRKVEYGLIYIGEPARKDNLVRLSGNIIRALEFLDRKPLLAIVTSTTIELHPLTQ